jgi:hypothetical protein
MGKQPAGPSTPSSEMRVCEGPSSQFVYMYEHLLEVEGESAEERRRRMQTNHEKKYAAKKRMEKKLKEQANQTEGAPNTHLRKCWRSLVCLGGSAWMSEAAAGVHPRLCSSTREMPPAARSFFQSSSIARQQAIHEHKTFALQFGGVTVHTNRGERSPILRL